MTWTSLAERFANLPLILAGPILRRTEPGSVTVWLALKEPRTVTLRIYARNDEEEELLPQFEGTRHTTRLGDHLHLVAVSARPAHSDKPLEWGALYYYDLFFQPDQPALSQSDHASQDLAHLDTPGILSADPSSADALHRLVYPGHPLPSFVLPANNLNQFRLLHGSCRKPHGAGKEMLSALDAILETTAHDLGQRPQQLYMTGDQIYADDVAAPLLFTLTDAGNFLLAGNRAEILPLLNIPASKLAPEGRAAAVRNKAIFTTTTPANHLLALAEYTAMYMCVWSDVLWPDDLPPPRDLWNAYPEVRPEPAQQQQEEAKYAEQVKRLSQFRDALPQVRRALANIATYTICDDHDVTDDWFLDGSWCRRVLASALGRRVVRNALLAYALFQAWGNTPDQFDEAKGAAFLTTLDAWRGDDRDTRGELLARSLGLPASFEGSGELEHGEEAFDWHYVFAGPCYQVIVMDTRTQRLYRTPNEVPGLLSPSAIQKQISAAVREDIDVTLIVSATPVLGVELIEDIQFWSRKRARDNYAYDCEAWALEWGTFQHFLKEVSTLKRVVFLAGDVHYAFGASLEYWDRAGKATARLVNYTSSPLRNEGSGLQMALLSVGYPYLFHLIGRQEMPAVDFFAWDDLTKNHHVFNTIRSVILSRLYAFWWSIPRLSDINRCPDELVLPAGGWSQGAFNPCPPDRRYRLHYIRDTLHHAAPQPMTSTREQRSRLALTRWILALVGLLLNGVTLVQAGIGRIRRKLARRALSPEQTPKGTHHMVRGAIKGADSLEQGLEERKNTLTAAIFHRERWLDQWKAGAYIVGYANIGEISFLWTPQEKKVTQRLWWWRPGQPERATVGSEYTETLDLPGHDAAPRLP